MKILFTASEAYPFFTSDGTGAIAGSLPPALSRRGAEVRVALPLYGDLHDDWRKKLKHIASFVVPVGWRNQYCGLFELVWQDVIWYFIDNEYYFKRQGLYGFYDDGERFAFFSRAVLETLLNIDFTPDVLHCNDWQTALVPVYLKLYYGRVEKLARLKTVFTIQDISRQCIYEQDVLESALGIGRENMHVLEYRGAVNLTKGAIETSDIVSTVSPSYAREILDPSHSYGLDDFLRKKQHKICGILNGIDIGAHNPLADPHIAANYGVDDCEEGKAACKKALRETFDLKDNGTPLIGVPASFTDDCGLDMFRTLAETLLDSGMQIAVLCAGETGHESFLRELAVRRLGKFGVRVDPSRGLERGIYAGSDMLLMLNKSEPCGFMHMVALRYGTAPIVHETGGLCDTVHENTSGPSNGFTFAAYEASDIKSACLRARDAYYNEEKWPEIVRNAMRCDNSWTTSAERYMAMYRQTQDFL
jgi:starch synthase